MNKFKISGFTMIELLIVMAIIGILATMMGGNYISVKKKSRDGQRKHELKEIQNALELYFNDYNRYPATGTIPFAATWEVSNVIYMKEVPQDPRHHLADQYEYIYQATDVNGTGYELYSVLENIEDMDCKVYSGVDCCDAGDCDCNYVVTSPNVQIPSGTSCS